MVKMKICVITTGYPSPEPGDYLGLFNKQFADELGKRNEIYLIRAKFRNKILRHAELLVRTLLALREDFDVIQCHHAASSIHGYLLKILKKRPLVVTLHGTDLKSRLGVFFAKRADRVVTVNEKMSEKFERVSVISCGIADYFKPSKKKKIIYIGVISKQKGVDILLEAVKDMDDVELYIIGYSKEFVEPELIKKLPENVVLIEKVPNRILPFVYESSDLVVLPSREESASQVIREALAVGVPIVATNVGGIPEIINKNLVEPNNVKQLRDEIKRQLKHPVLQKPLKPIFWKDTIPEYEKIYKSLVKK
jgi:glycosyltransferase involved in cell wall biosynthesis